MLFGHVHDQNGVCETGGVVYSNAALDSCRSNVASVMDFWMPDEAAEEEVRSDNRNNTLHPTDPSARKRMRAEVMCVDSAHFSKHDGPISRGGDICWETMTVAEAKVKALE